MMQETMTRNGVVYSRACSVSDIPALGGFCATLSDGTQVAVFRTNGTFRAVSQACPHQRYRVMSRCHVHDHRISCPMHGWTFDLCSGEESRKRGRIPVFEVLVVEASIYVAHDPDAPPSWM
ncbi:MAG: Rieske (2Fe-2S) protein, partial [Candidatus Kapaibacterium sp.]